MRIFVLGAVLGKIMDVLSHHKRWVANLVFIFLTHRRKKQTEAVLYFTVSIRLKTETVT